MIYATNQDIKNYGVIIQGQKLGPYYNYKDRPALLAAVMLMTDIPFFWEFGSPVPVEDRPSKLTITENALIDTLYEPIGRRMITGLLTDLDPWDFYSYLEGFPLYNLPFCKTGYCSPEQLRLMVKVRAGTWLLSDKGCYRGEVNNEALIKTIETVKKEIFKNVNSLSIH